MRLHGRSWWPAREPLFDGMGNYHRVITTSDPGAQLYFDQGMVLAFGFNHAESIRSFRAAERLDPLCAMCFWGEALDTGPNINVTSNGRVIMSAEDRVAAYEAIKTAVELQESATEIERSFIRALATRYSGDPLAIHLYIHAVEASSNPGRAEDEADRLANLVPGSGHLVHMPAHVYWRVGRYHDAAEANVRAAALDEAYIAAVQRTGVLPGAVLPSQYSLSVGGFQHGGTKRGRDRCRQAIGRQRSDRADRRGFRPSSFSRPFRFSP